MNETTYRTVSTIGYVVLAAGAMMTLFGMVNRGNSVTDQSATTGQLLVGIAIGLVGAITVGWAAIQRAK